MATYKDKKIISEIPASNNQILYIEPNKVISSDDNDVFGGFEEAPKLEDYSMYVNLQVEVRNRYTVSETNSLYSISWDGKSNAVSFQQGSRIYFDKFNKDKKNNNYVNAFTTDYADFSYEDRAGHEDIPPTSEMFGIKSIDINYDNYYVPQITIEFVDIRGISLFSPEQESHNFTQDGITGSKNPDYGGSFFKTFFSFPYPKFTLKVKGYYGKPISYELNCTDWRANFDCTNGNFGCTATFVGYSYALLSDITFNLLCAAPLTNIGQQYWQSNGGEIYDNLINGNTSPEQSTSPNSNNQPNSNNTSDDVNPNKFVYANDGKSMCTFKTFLEEMNAAEVESSSYAEQSDDAIQLKESNNNTIFYQNILDKLENVKTDFKSQPYGSETTIDGNGFFMFVSSSKPQVKDAKKYIDEFTKAIIDIRKDTSAKTIADNGDINTITGDVSNGYVSINDIDKNSKFFIEAKNIDTNKYLNNVDKNYVYYIEYVNLYQKLQENIKENSANATTSQNSIANQQSIIYNTHINFTPYVQNIIKMICAHIDTLIYLIEYTVKKVDNTKKDRFLSKMGISESDCPKDSEVPPFPKITTAVSDDNQTVKIEDGWIGDCVAGTPEEELVNELMSASKTLATVAKRTDNIANGNNNDIADIVNSAFIRPSMPYPIIPSDLILNNTDKMFGDVNIADTTAILRNLTMRCLNIIGTFKDISNTELGKIAQLDANNFYNFYPLNNSKFATATLNNTLWNSTKPSLYITKNGAVNTANNVWKSIFGNYFYWNGEKNNLVGVSTDTITVKHTKLIPFKNYNFLNDTMNIDTNNSYSFPKYNIALYSSSTNKQIFYTITNRIKNAKNKMLFGVELDFPFKFTNFSTKDIVTMNAKDGKFIYYNLFKLYGYENYNNDVFDIMSMIIYGNKKIIKYYPKLIMSYVGFVLSMNKYNFSEWAKSIFDSAKREKIIENYNIILNIAPRLTIYNDIVKIDAETQNKFDNWNSIVEKYDSIYSEIENKNKANNKKINEKLITDEQLLKEIENNNRSANVEEQRLLSPILNDINNYFFNEKFIIVKYQYDINNNNDNYQHLPKIKLSNLDTYIGYFVNELKKLYKANKIVDTTGSGNATASTESTNTEENKVKPVVDLGQVKEAKIAMYNYLKIIYDRWLCSARKSELDKWKLAEFYAKRFIFIDSFYYKIGQKVILDPHDLYQRILDSLRQESYSTVSFISEILLHNNMTFLCIQNFNDLSDPDSVKKAFTPYSYEEVDSNPPESNFICLYTYENSHTIGGNYDYEDSNSITMGDSFLITGDTQMTGLPQVITSKNDRNGYRMPCFGVTFGKQYQSYFQNIQVNMDSPVVTEQVIKTQYSLGNTAGANKGLQCIGQDLFTIYSNNSYQCSVTMLGCGWVQPTMYFSLLNIPMFSGTYMIMKTSHHIEPGNFTTVFTGNRLSKIANPLISNWMIGGDSLSIAELEYRKNQIAAVDNNCPYEFNQPEDMLLGTAAFNKCVNELKQYVNKISNMVEGECGGSINKIDSALLLVCIINRKLGTGWGKTWSKIFNGINPGDPNEFTKKPATNTTINFISDIINHNSILSVAKRCKGLNGNFNKLTMIDSWNGESFTNASNSAQNYKIKQSSAYFKDILSDGKNAQIFGNLGNNNKPYWKNTGDGNLISEEKGLSKQCIGLWRAIKATADDTPSLKDSNVKLLTQYNTKMNFAIQCDGNTGSKVFDMILMTYFKYIAGLWWICRLNDNTKSSPYQIYIRPRNTLNSQFEVVAFKSSINGNILRNIKIENINEDLKKTIQKASAGANNVDANVFKSKCALLSPSELAKVATTITVCSTFFSNDGGQGFGNGGSCSTDKGKTRQFWDKYRVVALPKGKFSPIGSSQTDNRTPHKITSKFMENRSEGHHNGVDIDNCGKSNGTCNYVFSIADGTVIMDDGNCVNGGHGFGHVIVIRHDNLKDGLGNVLYSLYGHMMPAQRLGRGEKIYAGQNIGQIAHGGNYETCGHSTGSHLHLSLYWDKPSNSVPFCHWVNPENYILHK